LRAGVLHVDETGWRVAGKTVWLWCFATNDAVYFMIDRARGSPALKKFFIQEFAGHLVSDFWGAYNKVACARRQMCLAHLLRDFLTVEQYKRPSDEWPAFAKKIRRLIHDAIRPAVIIRKNSYCNRSQRGADTQAVLMSVYRTLKLRGHDPIRTVIQAVREYLTTGTAIG
jgi:hypothetical protein